MENSSHETNAVNPGRCAKEISNDPHAQESGSRNALQRISRCTPVLLTLCLSFAALFVSFSEPRPALVWNASPSSPIGLYRVSASRSPRKGGMLLAFAPAPSRSLAARRGYVPYEVPLVKPVAAASGDRVCARGPRILINGALAVSRRARDRSGRPLPWWCGCRTLQRGEALLLSADVPDAFDGRYFGITEERDVIGEASLLFAA
jgi:conjugative transfer signal peptidase TraF